MYPYKKQKVTGFIDSIENNIVYARINYHGEEYVALIDPKNIKAPLEPGVMISLPGRRDARYWQAMPIPGWTETQLKRAAAKAQQLSRFFNRTL